MISIKTILTTGFRLKFLFVAGVINLLLSTNAFAISGWNAGRIIDDSVFTNSSSMTVEQIQTFLNSKVPVCDTNGEQLSPYYAPDSNGDGKVQRWEWGKWRINETKFICLKDYKTPDGRSAAQYLYDIGKQYQINPQVLIVLLQKENGLVTDTWPSYHFEYRTAAGYGCPDTADCDATYFGFENQVDWAATMYRAILNKSPTWYTPYLLGNNFVQYNPSSSCGGSVINIANGSTQGLYNYTPYQPNQAALNAGYGIGDSCSAYGNRNFYLYFTNWFGATRNSIYVSRSLEVTGGESNDLIAGRPIIATFSIINQNPYPVNLGKMVVAVRDSNGKGYDFGLKEVIVPASSQYDYEAQTILKLEDDYRFFISNYREEVGWDEQYPQSMTTSIVRSFYKKVSSPLSIISEPASRDVHVDEDVLIGHIFTNNSDQTVEIVSYSVCAENQVVNYCGEDVVFNATILPNQSVSKTSLFRFKYNSDNKLYVAYKTTTSGGNIKLAESTALTFNVKSAITITQGLSISSTRSGEIATGTFKIKNFSSVDQPLTGRLCYIIRGPQSQGLDLGCIEDKIIKAGQEITYTGQRVLPYIGAYRAYFSTQMPDGRWHEGKVYPGEIGTESTALTFNVL